MLLTSTPGKRQDVAVPTMRPFLRRGWLKAHRWLGLSLGMVLMLAAFTGSLLLLADPLDKAINQHLFTANDPGSVAYGAVMQKIRGEFPPEAAFTLRPPRHPGESLQVIVRGPWTGTVFLHPVTAKELGRRGQSEGFAGFLFTIHSSLFAGEVGKAVLALAALAYVVMLVSGLVLWWPIRWGQAFSIRTGVGLTRSLFDWHRVGGAVLGLLVLVSVASGAYMAWQPLAKLVTHLSSAQPLRPPVVLTAAMRGDAIGTAVERAQALFADAMIGYVQVPNRTDAPVRVRLRLPDDPHPNGLTSVWLHPASAEVLAVHRWNELDLGSRAYSYVYPLHIGELGGIPLMIVTFLLGMSLPGFAITGIWLWWRRRANRKQTTVSQVVEPEKSSRRTHMLYRIVSLLSILLLLTLSGIAYGAESTRTVLHLLDYIAVDYAGAVEDGKIKSVDEYKEMREFAGQAQEMIKGLQANPAQPALLAEATSLAQAIDAKTATSVISTRASALRWAVIRAYNVQVTPKSAPELKRGAGLYAAQCAVCHGVGGRGDGPAAKGLDPKPSDFHDLNRMAQRSAYGLYNTVTLGVDGTAMASFGQLSEQDRWALAFFVANFSADDAVRTKGAALWRAGKGRDQFPDIANVVTLSTNEVKERFGDDGVALQAFLRDSPQALMAAKPAPIEFAVAALDKSLDAYRQGARAEAAQLAIQAYLEGFELIEASLQNVDPELMTRIEREMMAYRSAIQSGAPVTQVEREASVVIASLDEARAKLAGSRISQTTTFVSALVILLREGAEAILVVAAILAFTTRAGRKDARRWVHVGWIAALALGLVTWVVSNYLVEISGASREITEGVTALVAAAMLLYVGYWLHSKSHSQAWQKFIGNKVTSTLSAGTVWTLGLVSFLAVYREAFETVLFYQALLTQAGPQGHAALLGGLVAGAALLVAVAWTILRASVKLPIGLFFSVSGIVLVVLAVIFTGQGIAALQEAGKIGSDAVSFIRLPLLGIYPTLQTLTAQAAAIVISAVALWWATRARKSVMDDATTGAGL